MWLVFCEDRDAPARWLCKALRHRGFAPLLLICSSDLGPGLCWSHRLGVEPATAQLTLSKKKIVASSEVQGVINRLFRLPSWYPRNGVSSQDWQYGRDELAAFLLSWLSCLPGPMLNRPTPQGLSGRERHPAEWFALASQAGLSITRLLHSTGRGIDLKILPKELRTAPQVSVLVIGTDVIGAPEPYLVEPLQQMGAVSDTAIIGVNLIYSTTSRRWLFFSATTRPDLRIGGDRALTSIEQQLKWGAR